MNCIEIDDAIFNLDLVEWVDIRSVIKDTGPYTLGEKKWVVRFVHTTGGPEKFSFDSEEEARALYNRIKEKML